MELEGKTGENFIDIVDGKDYSKLLVGLQF